MIGAGFAAISLDNTILAIVDDDGQGGLAAVESGAIPTYLAGDDERIADIVCYARTWGATARLKEPLAGTITVTPHIRRWLDSVGARPAVRHGMTAPA